MEENTQQIRTVLIPESGLDLEPEFVRQSTVETDFIRSLAHLVGKAPNTGILIRATSDGSLRVVSAGVPFEEYITFTGTGADAYAAPNILEYLVAYNVTDFLIETHPAFVSFRNLAGVWLGDKILPVGMHSIDFIHYGYRIRNRNAGNNTVFETTIYR